jgi:phosphoserine phosphatase
MTIDIKSMRLRKKMGRNNCRFYCYFNTREKIKFNKPSLKKLKLFIFDMDGVLTDIVSSWKYVHDYYHTNNDLSVDKYLKGEIDDLEFIKRDSLLWTENGKPITYNKLKDILSDVPKMKGVKDCLRYLKERNIKTAIISAGINVLANRIKKELDIDFVYSNGVKIDNNGYITGEGILSVKLMYKDITVKKLAKRLDIKLDNIASVGNSCFDIPMFRMSGLGIAFNPRDDCVRKSADIIIEDKDLSLIIPVLEKKLEFN